MTQCRAIRRPRLSGHGLLGLGCRMGLGWVGFGLGDGWGLGWEEGWAGGWDGLGYGMGSVGDRVMGKVVGPRGFWVWYGEGTVGMG